MTEHLIYGIDNEQNIVAIEPVPGKPLVQIFTRIGDEVVSRYEKYEYFLYTNAGSKIDKEYCGELLIGENFYDRLVKFTELADFYNAKKLDEHYAPYLNCQYLLHSGKTLFKGMDISEPLVLFFDIETYTHPDYEFPNSERNSDRIIIIAVKTNKGDNWVLTDDSEKKLIDKFVSIVRTVDPDVIANHNIFNFDLRYLKDRAKKCDVSLALGRDGSEPTFFDTKIKFADREKDYLNCDIYGRHVIDTQFLAEYADVVLRNMPSYGLKDLVKYLGKASKDRVYIEGSDISWYWDNDRESLLKYALDDVVEAEILYYQYSVPYFMLTTMIPMSYQQVFRYGTGTQIDYLFLREYYRQQASFPKPDPQRSFSGGYAAVLEFGLIQEPLMYADVESLYPSLGKLLKIQPKKDFLGLYQKVLNLLVDKRFEIKDKIKEYKAKGEHELAAKQKSTDGAVKILLNTMSFGWLGWTFGSFNDYDEAERITKEGQKIVKRMIAITNDLGGRAIKADTDGVLLVPPPQYQGDEQKELEYCNYLTEQLPEGIRIGHDGRYKAAIAFDGKSYALYEYDNSLTIKGNTLRGRNVEPFGAAFIKSTVLNLLNNNIDKIKKEYNDLKFRVENRMLEAEELMKRNNLNMSLEEYKNRTESGNTNKIAAYELAIDATREYGKGDVIKHYVKEPKPTAEIVRGKVVVRKPKLAAFETAELIEHYDYDYDVNYYLDRLDTIIKKFIVLGQDLFEQVFDVEIKNADKKRYTKITKKEY